MPNSARGPVGSPNGAACVVTRGRGAAAVEIRMLVIGATSFRVRSRALARSLGWSVGAGYRGRVRARKAFIGQPARTDG
jgi:hypothetical protein